jgi:nucleoside-diphosphate-sugar epimerase
MGVPHFLFISSLNMVPAAAHFADSDATLYPEPNEGYAASKWQSEIALKAVCQRHEQALTIIRPALIYDKELTANLARLAHLMRWWPAALPAVGNRCLISRPDLIELIVDRAVQSLPSATPSTVLAGTDGQQYDAARISAALACRQMLGNDARVVMSLGRACFGLAWRIGARRDVACTHSALLEWYSTTHFGLAAKMDVGLALSG